MTPEEVSAILDHVSNIKHKAILSTIYSSGLRINEAAHLRISDIDSKNMRVFVRQGKVNKDRYTFLTHKNLLNKGELILQGISKEEMYEKDWIVYCKKPFKEKRNIGYC